MRLAATRCLRRGVQRWFVFAALLSALVSLAPSANPLQFEGQEPPAETRQLDFMVGDWWIQGSFRRPDFVDQEQKLLWYLLEDGRLQRFDGARWSAFAPGADPAADSVRAAIMAKGGTRDWFEWRTRREARWTRGGFVLVVDDGRQGGQHLLFYSRSRGKWLMQSIHAPTEAWAGPPHEGSQTPEGIRFAGISRDRRGEHRLETLIRRLADDHYSVRQDASFDGGRSWIRDQLIYDVRRATEPSTR